MFKQESEDWREIAEAIQDEADPGNLLVLVRKLLQSFDEHERKREGRSVVDGKEQRENESCL